jgi:UDP-3-O-[3-hydroxymyristoyl] glucosamine N-acyltransferase
VAVPPPIGADAVVAARRTPLRRAASALRLARAAAAARGRLRTGRGVWAAPGVRIRVAHGARVTLGTGVELGAGARLEASAGELAIGDRTRVGDRAAVHAVERVEIGADAVLGDWALVTDEPEPSVTTAGRRVVIGPGARIAAHATVRGGARVGAGAAVGSYALVRGPVDAGASVAGVPARPVRSSA